MKYLKITTFTAFLLLLLMTALAVPGMANSAEPPSIEIIVANAPQDLVLSIDNSEGDRKDEGNASYFFFYRMDLQSGEKTLKVSLKGESFEIPFVITETYNNVFTLDLNSRDLTRGKSFLMSLPTVSLRVVSTLILEGIIFFLFGFRSKLSWILFLIINLITQGILNLWLSGMYSPLDSYIIFSLIGGEVVVIFVELIAFGLLLNEHGKGRRVLYVLTANLLSLVAGGYLIIVLPF